MRHARAASTVNVVAVRDLVWNGHYSVHKQLVDILTSESVFEKSSRPFQGRQEIYNHGLAIMARLLELKEIHHWDDTQLSMAMNLADENIPLGLHLVAFQPVIMSQGSQEQVSSIGNLAQNLAILGAYAQTELGHGSNVSRLETTATYIPEAEEFEIHSPTLTSTKWWVGGLGKSSTHAVVQAQLILPGNRAMGPHLFFVQLRSMETHSTLDGIRLGDIGPKAFGGFAALDNGFARFDRVRIPRTAMLSKFAQVTKNGEYIKPPHDKLSYGGMIYIRSSMITGFGQSLAKGITIAIRYSTVRRQGGQESSSNLERRVITYPSLYIRLIPILSQAYVFMLLGRSMNELFASMSARLALKDTSLLAETHAISSGLKSYVTRVAVDSLAICRAALGGHGYSAFAGVGRIWASSVPGMTYEGDNYVLDQQVVRAAVKSYRNLTTSSSSLPPSSRYLHLLQSGSAVHCQIKVDWDDMAASVVLLEWRAALSVQSMAQGHDINDASADHRVAFAITEAFIARRVLECVERLALPQRDEQIVGALLKLYMLTMVEGASGDLLALSLLAPGECIKELRITVSRLCVDLLPELIGLTDAFGFTDWELDSALGKYDGAVYDELWKRAQEEPLNQKDVVDGYKTHIKPMLQRGAKLGSGQKEKSKL
ncbi:hypothetical protein FRB95_014589 [Tulasnella sp. JGI-2019a]|nr:hypothetical protein FRB95_014589 [Tulasnella sp. JGI-2019a]